MNATVIGAVAAVALAIVWITLGFWAFVLVVIAALVDCEQPAADRDGEELADADREPQGHRPAAWTKAE